MSGFARKSRGVLLALPAFLLLLLFGVALFALLPASVHLAKGGDGSLTLLNYGKILTDPLYLGYLTVTLRISLVTAAASLLLGLPFAYWMMRAESRLIRSALIILTTIPFLTGMITKLYALSQLLANSGLINLLLRKSGVIAEGQFFPLIRNETGVTIGTVSFALPFVIFMLAGVFRRHDRSLEDAAQSLGADELSTFCRITLPLLMPGIVGAGLLAFVLTGVAFASPLILGGGSVNMIANAIYNLAVVLLDRHLSAALAVLALLMSLAILSVSGRLGRRSLAHDGR